MLRSSALSRLLFLCLLAPAGAALAQQTPPAKPSEAPPKLEVIEEGSDTPITVTPPATGGAKISEKKEGGRITEAKVKSGKSTYTMKGTNPAAVAERGNGPGSTLGAPKWTVMEFDLAKKKKTDKEAVPEADAPPPPPPPAQKAK